MRTFAQESKASQEAASAKATTPGSLHFGQSRELSSLLHWQRTLGNRAVQRMLRTDELEPGQSSKDPGRFAHDFSRTPTAHGTRQNALAPLGGAVQRKDKKPAPAPAPAKSTAAGGPQLDFRPAKNEPPCACIVFIHHNEPNARLMAQAMYEFCRYNLAIVDPQTSAREINLPGKGRIDPNELFPRKVAEECWADDKPCQEFLDKNGGATKGSVVEEYAQRQFFLAIKKCSKGFSLPVVALHNNTIDETADYRKAVGNTKSPLDLTPVKGKTFDDSLKAGAKSADPGTLPFVELEDWLEKNVPGVSKRKAPKGKRTLEGGPITPGKTNIFLWCSAADISRCHIGDPERPDNVVWVTNTADFEKLRATKTNVVLQTRVDPGGLSATDLSSLFVFLQEIVGTHFAKIITDLQVGIAVDAKTIQDAIDELGKLNEHDDLTLGNAWDQLKKILLAFLSLLGELLVLLLARGEREVRLSQLRFINIETPQTAYDPSTTKPADLRVQSYRDVRATLGAIGLDCCDAAPSEGETESAVEKVEEALRKGTPPKE